MTHLIPNCPQDFFRQTGIRSTDDLFQRKSLQCTKLSRLAIDSPLVGELCTDAITLPAVGCVLILFVLGNPGPTHCLPTRIEVYSLTRINKPSLTYSSRRKDPTTSTKRCLMMLRSMLRELGTKVVVSLHKLYHVICMPNPCVISST